MKSLVHRAPPLTIAALTFSIAALTLLPVLLVERPEADAGGWTLLVYLGVVPTALAYIRLGLGGAAGAALLLSAVLGLTTRR